MFLQWETSFELLPIRTIPQPLELGVNVAHWIAASSSHKLAEARFSGHSSSQRPSLRPAANVCIFAKACWNWASVDRYDGRTRFGAFSLVVYPATSFPLPVWAGRGRGAGALGGQSSPPLSPPRKDRSREGRGPPLAQGSF